MNTIASSACPRNRGFTLIELMVVLTVLGAMMAFAVPSFKEYKRNAALTNTANMLVSSVYRTRSEAMKDGVSVIMLPGNASGPSGSADWTQGWVIYADRNGNDAYDAPTDTDTKDGDPIFVQPGDEIPPSDNVRISVNRDGFVRFNGAGFPKGGGGNSNLTLTVCIKTDVTPVNPDASGNNCADVSPRRIRRVIISTSGRVRTCRPDRDSNCGAGTSAGGGGGSTT